MGGKRITPDILDYLSQRAGKPVALQRMAADLELEERQVQQSISHLRRQGGLAANIQVLQHGQVWRWIEGSGEAPQSPQAAKRTAQQAAPQGLQKGDMVEIMGSTQGGDAVAGDGNGLLYRVVPL